MLDDDAVVRMRAADAAEKLTAGHPELLAPFKATLLDEVAAVHQQEVRWHVAQMIPRLALTRTERAKAVAILTSYLGDDSAIVQTFSMQALADLAGNDARRRARTAEIVEDLVKRGSPAVRSRGRRLLAELRGEAGRRSPGRARAARGTPVAGASAADAALVARLQAALSRRAEGRSRRFWERYLKGTASFRGVPMGGVRAAVHAWWRDEGLAGRPLAERKRLALRLFEGPHTEDRLAGVLALSELLLPELSASDLPAFARLFEGGLIADWNLCDWFCVKVLGRMVERSEDPAAVARAISAWRTAVPLWQRRASCVAFVNLARHGDRVVPGLPAMIVDSAARVVADPARFAQTGVGWVLRELSGFDAGLVSRFAEAHLSELSREAMGYVTARLPPAERRRLLDLHRKARGGRPPARARAVRPRRGRGSASGSAGVRGSRSSAKP
jgi:3-methyladenine DNA glycosylase AlkD